MTLEGMRRIEVDGATWYHMEDAARWLKVNQAAAHGLLRRDAPGSMRVFRVERSRRIGDAARVTHVTADGVIQMAAELSMTPNRQVRDAMRRRGDAP